MSIWNEIKTFWPIAAALTALGVRIEVGQALNRQAIRNLRDQRTEDRDDTREMLREIRADIKSLLQRDSGGGG